MYWGASCKRRETHKASIMQYKQHTPTSHPDAIHAHTLIAKIALLLDLLAFLILSLGSLLDDRTFQFRDGAYPHEFGTLVLGLDCSQLACARLLD